MNTSITNMFTFKNPEYQKDGSFEEHEYTYEEVTNCDDDGSNGWKIFRDGKLHMMLGKGYVPIQTLYCGVCSTDLAKKFLPYPLPQIVGHEVVGKSISNTNENEIVVVEINASEYARQVNHDGNDNTSKINNPYDTPSMHTHDPMRITLGIDRLPGGFSPIVLAPVGAVIPVPPSISIRTAALTEPFAAALQGVESTPPQNGDVVAVLGPRRLGALILAALDGYRRSFNLDFEIVAISRHPKLLDVSLQLGANTIINNAKEEIPEKQYDIVFDTTGRPEGFALALKMAKRIVHLKSTNGQKVQGLQYLTDLVVDEMALLSFSKENLNFTWPYEQRTNPSIFVSPSVSQDIVDMIEATGRNVVQDDILSTYTKLTSEGPLIVGDDELRKKISNSPFPRFDLAVVSTLSEVDDILRPKPGIEISLVRARGAILLTNSNNDDDNGDNNTLLYNSIMQSNMSLHSSRCGNFESAIKILNDNPIVAQRLEEQMITHTYDLKQIDTAFEIAADSSQSIKVLVNTQTLEATT